MEIISRTEGNKVTMEITGWLDTQTAPQLEEELQSCQMRPQALYLTLQNWNISLPQVCARSLLHTKKCSRKKALRS